ncbi:MAG: peptidoglycan-binding protein [Myxococcales bacterium]|nr:peptidoglycan-binding protein [Myxococcales bacterium]
MSFKLLAEGATGQRVRKLQEMLNAAVKLKPQMTVTGKFDAATREAVCDFQRTVFLKVDGVVGRATWRKLLENPASRMIFTYRAGPQEPLADVAATYIGATESPINRMGNDDRMREIFEADALKGEDGATDGYAWCAAFVSLCVQKLIATSLIFRQVKAPRVASVTMFRTRWAPAQSCLIFEPGDPKFSPHKGDIVVFTFSHIGIVESVTSAQQIETIEGNTNEQGSREGTTCRRKSRSTTLVHCFIRLPVPEAYDDDRKMCMVPERPSETERYFGIRGP